MGTPGFNDWATYGYDAARDDFNANSTAISPTGIAGGKLHLAWQATLYSGTAAQPIVATNVAGHKAIVIVSSSVSLLAYDAVTGSKVWGPINLPEQNMQACGDGGVAGTSYYDAALGALFVVAGNGLNVTNHPTLYELSVATGAMLKQVDLTPLLLTGETTSAHTAVTFANGLLYAGTASNCEAASWRGRVVAVDPTTMTLKNTFYTTYGVGENFGGGGVWGWGGVSSDANGNVYAAAGNAETPETTEIGTEGPPFAKTTDEQAGYAEHLVKLSSDLSKVEDSNYPGFNFQVGYADLDYTGTPVVFTPDGCNTYTATQGKGGTLVINNTTKLVEPKSYQLSEPSGLADYIGNPAYSPVTGLLYAAVTSSQEGSLEPPGMVAFQFSCGSSILWHAQFGPDSFSYESSGPVPRSAPTVTAGGVVFMGTPCTSNGSGGCGTPGSANGALWAVDASTGNVLGGGNPLLTTPNPIKMAATVDGLWVYVMDSGGNVYALTVDPAIKTATQKRGYRAIPKVRYPR